MYALLMSSFIDVISVLGTIVTIFGFIITVEQIKSTKKQVVETDKKVDDAINKTRYEINQLQYIKEITLLIKDIDAIIEFLNERRTDIAFYLMRNKQAQLYKIYDTDQYRDCLDKDKFKLLVDQYATIQEGLCNIKNDTIEHTIVFSSSLLNQIKRELITTSNNIENRELWNTKSMQKS
jgi:hypothetical protein